MILRAVSDPMSLEYPGPVSSDNRSKSHPVERHPPRLVRVIRGWFRRHRGLRGGLRALGGDTPRASWGLLVLAAGLVTTPAMAQNPCASEVWSVAPASFSFPASVNSATLYSISVTNSPASTYCQWALGVLAGSDTSWYVANQNGQTGVNIKVDPNCPGQAARSGTLLIFALDPHTMAPTGGPVAIIPLSQASVTLPVLSNLSPNGGQSYALGSKQTITWTYTPSSDASVNDTGTVYLLRNQLAIQLLGTVPLGAQTFPWVVPASIVPTGFFYEVNVLGEASDSRYPGCPVLTSVTSQAPFEIRAPAVQVSCPNTSGAVDDLYSSVLSGSEGEAPYTFSIASGSLPTGLTLTASTGAIEGSPIAAGTSTFTAQVVDSLGAQGTMSCSIVVDRCNYHIEGPSDVPGLSQYTYELQLPAGDVAAGLKWTADKPTASISAVVGSTGASAIQAVAVFQNTKPDYINLKASFTLKGKQACAVKPVALVQVTVLPATFTNNALPSSTVDNRYSYLVKPPVPASTPRPWWTITHTPGSDWEQFVYVGGRQRAQAAEPGVVLDSHTAGGPPAYTATSAVALTSPPEKPNAQQRIEVGFIQAGTDTGTANYAGGLTRTVMVPATTTVDWMLSASKGPGKNDEWPWYSKKSRKTGEGSGSWTSDPPLSMADLPGLGVPTKYNPNDASAANSGNKIVSATETFSFTLHMGARTLNSALGADTHYFSEADTSWKANFVWPLATPNLSIVTASAPWTTPAAPAEIPVNVVPTTTNHNIPYFRWNPATCPPAVCPLNP
jgi:hypothetical protein